MTQSPRPSGCAFRPHDSAAASQARHFSESLMAEGRLLICGHCAFEVMAWSDANPYYFDSRGRKRYAHHPDHENLARCIGLNVPHLCIACGEEIQIDAAVGLPVCPMCKSDRLVDMWEREGHQCPKCRSGRFVDDPRRGAVS